MRQTVVREEQTWLSQHQHEVAERLAAMRVGDRLDEDSKKATGRMLDAQRHELAVQHGAKLAELRCVRYPSV
jgi:hypothetical protein